MVKNFSSHHVTPFTMVKRQTLRIIQLMGGSKSHFLVTLLILFQAHNPPKLYTYLQPWDLNWKVSSEKPLFQLSYLFPNHHLLGISIYSFNFRGLTIAWMSQEVSNCLVNGLFHLLINRMYWGYNPLILTFYQHFLSGTSKWMITSQP